MAKTAHSSFTAEKTQVPALKSFIEKQLTEWKVAHSDIQDIVLASDEAATNIVMHGYGNVGGDQTFDLTLRKKGKVIEVILEDTGKVFDIGTAPDPDVSLNLAGKRRGGFGIFLMKTLMDRIKYQSQGGKNKTCMFKKISV